MRGVDTNVLLRTFDHGNAAQSGLVDKLLDEAAARPLFVNHIVLSEFAWTLERSYRRPPEEIALRLRHLLEAPEFVVQDAAVVAQAIDAFEAGGTQFPDCLIGATNLACSCSTTLTFDRDAVALTDLFSPVPN